MMKSLDPQTLVFIDESGVQNNMTRLYGRIIGGTRLKESAPGGHWNTTTILSAIRSNGSTESMTIEGATTAEVFTAYVSKILCPTLRPTDVVILDNLSSHKVSGIREAIEKTGAILKYLPPYSPDLNPIEKMWSKIKTILRKFKARSGRQLMIAIKKALMAISSSDAIGWFKSCGYGIN
jgi:transposase